MQAMRRARTEAMLTGRAGWLPLICASSILSSISAIRYASAAFSATSWGAHRVVSDPRQALQAAGCYWLGSGWLYQSYGG